MGGFMTKRVMTLFAVGLMFVGLSTVPEAHSQNATESLELDPQKTYVVVCTELQLQTAKRSQTWRVESGTVVEKAKDVYSADPNKELWLVSSLTSAGSGVKNVGVLDLKNGDELYRFTGDQKIPVCSEEKK